MGVGCSVSSVSALGVGQQPSRSVSCLWVGLCCVRVAACSFALRGHSRIKPTLLTTYAACALDDSPLATAHPSLANQQWQMTTSRANHGHRPYLRRNSRGLTCALRDAANLGATTAADTQRARKWLAACCPNARFKNELKRGAPLGPKSSSLSANGCSRLEWTCTLRSC